MRSNSNHLEVKVKLFLTLESKRGKMQSDNERKGDGCMLDGFTQFTFGGVAAYASITKNGISFNKVAVGRLNSTPYVLLFLNAQNAQFAIKKATANEAGAIPFGGSAKKGSASVRWNSKELLRAICDMIGWNLEAKNCNGYKVFAQYDKSESALIFDLKEAIPIA